jgi:hypothetical protein
MEKGILETKNGFYCYINNQYYSTIRGLSNYLRGQSMTSEEYYLKYLGDAGKCESCGNPTRFKRITVGYSKYCCSACAVRSESHRKSVSERFIGDQEKLLKSIEKRRVTNSQKSEEEIQKTHEKRRLTIIKKYGENYHSNKTKAQWERRTQDEIDSLVAKATETKKRNNTLYTAPYKHANKKVIIGEKIFKVQGYEDIALNLLSKIIDVNEIKVGKDVPRISLSTGKNYYPDIYIYNLLIEVKSEYTYEVCLEENLLKHNESIKAGYDHIFLVIHSKDVRSNRSLKNEEKYLKILHEEISSQASQNEEGSTTILLQE